MNNTLSDRDFRRFQGFIHDTAGIRMSDAKKMLVGSRLMRRVELRARGNYGTYFDLIASGQDPLETQTAVDLLTTNETYFFREPKHFEFLRRLVQAQRAFPRPFRVWSAASSSGEEPYSIAMLLADCLGQRPWEVFGSDLSARMLERARTGHYVDERARHVPERYLKAYCLRGIGQQEGTLMVDRSLRERVKFAQINLTAPLPQIGRFDVVFLRNVMIYFDDATKRKVVERVLEALVPGGHLLVGHSESIVRLVEGLEVVTPAIYRKPA